MGWHVEGTFFENCNCEVVCPCGGSSFALPADYDRCRLVLAFHVDSGSVEGVDVSGRNVILVTNAPRQMSDGNWDVGIVREGRRGALVMGLQHGAFCTGCCWMLMALLFVVGVMNLVWGAGITAFVLAEKVLPWKRAVVWTAAIACLLSGGAVIGSAFSGGF